MRRKGNILRAAVGGLLLFLVSAPVARGTPLPPATLIPGPGDAFLGLTGTILATASGTFDTAGHTMGTFTTAVLAGDATNPLGGLDFLYQVSVTTGDPVTRLTAIDFTGFLTDVGFDADVILSAPVAGAGFVNGTPVDGLAKSIDRSASGMTIGFNYQVAGFPVGTLPAGSTSAVLVIKTNAQFFTGGPFLGIQDGGTAQVAAFSPTVPLPGVAVAGFSLFGLLGGKRLIKARKQ